MSADLPPTEWGNPRTADLDVMDTANLVEVLVDDQRGAVEAVRAQTKALAEVVAAVSARIADGGHLHYVGAGSSGRLGVLDAAEMPPTFGTAREVVCAHIAGGSDALVRAVEGAEDDAAAGAAAMTGHVSGSDAVIGISASGSAAFVAGAIDRARVIGAYTVALTNVPGSALARSADIAVILPTGAEALAGSTRLKAGTAQKIALNTISTAVMVRLGKVHGNLMVDVVAGNRKLHERAVRLVRALAGVDRQRALELLAQAQGRVKVAIVMERRGVDAETARGLLAQRAGVLRSLL
jgi:N-acetylmuramic acid 6-phosphate etherase